VVVDLRYDQLCLIAGALDGRGLIGSPLAPQAGPDQRRERNDGGNHQPQELRSNAAEQHRFSLFRSRTCSPRGRARIIAQTHLQLASVPLIRLDAG